MRKIIFLAAALIVHMTGIAQTNEYKLVWSDEFNTEGPVDTTNWQFEQGFTRNNEDQWYQLQNAQCRKGMLVIEAKKEHKNNPWYKQGSDNWRFNRQFINYTSASINTSGKQAWQYGRFVMRAKIEIDPGLWPAFWTLGVKGEWPSNGEIDIMEYYKGNLLANIAKGTDKAYNAKWFTTSRAVETFKDPSWAKKFHVWRMDWDENEISLYVDDILLNKVAMADLVNESPDKLNPFMQPHYILLNLAIGGDNGGDPSTTTFPRKYLVDYVRVYQK
jgi:beta-glucanase (GH16 family)